MDICLRVLKESNKSRFDSYSVRNSVLIISHITFRDCRVHMFSDNLSLNSCIYPDASRLGILSLLFTSPGGFFRIHEAKAFDSPVPDLLCARSEYCQSTTSLTKFRCKNYYNLFIENLLLNTTQ